MNFNAPSFFSTLVFSFVISQGLLIAASSANPDLKNIQPRIELSGRSLKVLPPPDHHFNMEAPNAVKSGKENLLSSKTEAFFSAEIPKNVKSVQVKAFICDEKKSYCVERSMDYRVPSSSVAAKSDRLVGRKDTIPKAIAGEAATVQSYYDSATGFWVNDIEKAFAEAQAKNLPLLLDFYGIWCPPCNQLDFQVFSQQDFVQFFREKFVGLKLDSDAQISKALMKKYNIKYFPTLLATTKDGDEIMRVLGFREKGSLMKLLNQAYLLREQSQTKLAELAKAGNPEAQIALGALSLEREEFPVALELFKPFEKKWRDSKDQNLEKFFRAQFGAEKDSSKKIEIAEEWFKLYPHSLYNLLVYDEVADLYEQKKKAKDVERILKTSLQAIQFHESRPESEFNGTDFTKGDLYIMKASTFDRLTDKEKAQAAYAECNSYYLEQVKGKKGFGRGEELNRAYCLRKQGIFDQAQAVYKKGMDLYPKDFTFFLGMGRLKLEDQKIFSEAESFLRSALELAYGNQRIRTSIYLTRALEAQQKNTDALKVVLKELSLIGDPREMGYERLKKRMGEIETLIAKPNDAETKKN